MAAILEKLGSLQLKIENRLHKEDKTDGEVGLVGNGQAGGDERKEKKQARQDDRAQAVGDKRDRDLEEIEADALETGPENIRTRFGVFSKTQIDTPETEDRVDLDALKDSAIGTSVCFRARVHTRRNLGSKLVFFLFRQRTTKVQGVIEIRENAISELMVRWAGHVPVESVVLVYGVVQKPHEEIKYASFGNLEILVEKLYVISKPSRPIPFNIYRDETEQRDEGSGKGSESNSEPEDEREKGYLSRRTRLDNRILDLRETSSQTIFRINAMICNVFRSFLDSRGFLEIHTPKLQGGATESGASVFQVNYFGRPAFLAQSPQLAKQMAIASDFERVYEIGPVFRAENSNTHRHLTEYTGLDLEMAIEKNYDEMLSIVDEMFKHLWATVYERFANDIPQIEGRFPHQKLEWLDKTPRIPFSEGIGMLKDSGFTDDDGEPLGEEDDLSTKGEIRLGELVKEKYSTDYYILDKFPASARPFYTMPDPDNSKLTNSFDIMLRGQEILSGGQRIHEPKQLEDQMRKLGVHPESLDEYMEGFRLATPPHAGAGIGLERVIMLLLNLEDVRWASFAHRDPRSLPEKPKIFELRHPDANTLELARAPRERTVKGEYEPVPGPPLEMLIANYGDAANTSWLDERYQIWRDDHTGAAIGFVPSHTHAIIVGEPLCDKSQFHEVIPRFLEHVHEDIKLKPIWILVGYDVEDLLGKRHGWRTMTCIAESRAKTDDHSVSHDASLRRKIRHAENDGVKIIEEPNGAAIPKDVRDSIDARVRDWSKGRTGTQVHLTEIDIWMDVEHRRYLYAKDKSGEICAVVVLHQLSMKNGFQVKFALEFPGAPSGTIEAITMQARDMAADEGAEGVTFGTSATSNLTASQNMGGLRVKLMKEIYESIANGLKLTQKSDFREKLGATEDPVFICYPPHAMGPKGIKSIMDFLQAES